MIVDRRKNRTNLVGVALEIWLRAIVERSQLTAIVLADPTGLLIASSFTGEHAEVLAAVTPIYATTSQPSSHIRRISEVPLSAAQICAGEYKLYLGIVGPSQNVRDGMEEVVRGVQRILAH